MTNAALPLLPDGKRLYVYDIEVFPNAVLVCIEGYGPKPIAVWVRGGGQSLAFLRDILVDQPVVMCGYNNHGYDDIIMRALLKGATCDELFKLSLKIIEGGEEGDQTVWRLQYSDTPWAYSIDVFQLLNQKGSLKEWECREGMDRVAESPVDFLLPIAKKDEEPVVGYCLTDVGATSHLTRKYWHLIDLRHRLNGRYELGNRIYCMSEAKLAQHVFMTLHENRTTQRISRVRDAAKKNPDNLARSFKLTEIVSSKVGFQTPRFKKLLEVLMRSCVTSTDAKGTTWKLPETFKKPIQLGQKQYQIGVGGLHSIDAPGEFVSDDDNKLVDLDVASYYPSLIINERLAPRHIGPGFLKDMTALRDARLLAKRTGDKGTNEALKIVINSTFGKLNDAYSPIRSIPDALRVTVNGQLMLLMLIETLEELGAEVLSANTDGVTIRWGVLECELLLPQVIDAWQERTHMELEAVEYVKICRRDVNSYMALKKDGKVKYKGAFNPEPDKGKWDGLVVKRAAEAYLLKGIDPLDYVKGCTDIRAFFYYQRVQNGGHIYYGEQLLGRVARWYVAKKGEQIKRKNPKGKTVWANIPNGGNAKLALDITGWTIKNMKDIDHGHYATEAWDLIASVKDTK